MADWTFPADTRFSHAYIISTSDAKGNLNTAMHTASAILCSGGGARPCGKCRDCRKVASGSHPDLGFVRRQADESGKEKREIVVKQIRELAEDAIVRPNEATKKVYIIDQADTMNLQAQNAALKLFEEPPAFVCFLLCAENPQMLLQTVRSRCADIRSLHKSDGRQQEAEGESETLKKAKEYLKALASGDELQLLTWCFRNEGMDGRTAGEFLASVQSLIADMLAGRKNMLGLKAEDLLELYRQMDQYLAWLNVNISAKQIFGLLACSMPGTDRNGEPN